MRPELLEHKALRELRAALHPIVEHQLKKYDPIDYASRVTAAFRAGKGADALLALQGLHSRSQSVRQGTVQRWVRDCDAIADVGLRVKLLHAVLRAGNIQNLQAVARKHRPARPAHGRCCGGFIVAFSVRRPLL